MKVQKHCVLKYRKLASMHPSYNFMFTREPIHRLYSCWKDKIYKREGHQYYYEKANKKIFLSEGRALLKFQCHFLKKNYTL